MGNVLDCKVSYYHGRRLQLIPDRRPRDHLPLLLVLDYILEMRDGASNSAEKKLMTWDLQMLSEALQTGKGRDSFLLQLEDLFTQHENEFISLREDRRVDEHWSL
eukprot:5194937-Pyramimonas_sp.AAC.1